MRRLTVNRIASAICFALALLSAAHYKQLQRFAVNTLVLYVFRHTDAESAANLKFSWTTVKNVRTVPTTM